MGTDYIIAYPEGREFIHIGKVGNWFCCLLAGPVHVPVDWLDRHPLGPGDRTTARMISFACLHELRDELREEQRPSSKDDFEREWRAYRYAIARSPVAWLPSMTFTDSYTNCYLLDDGEPGYFEVTDNWRDAADNGARLAYWPGQTVGDSTLWGFDP